MPSSNTITSFFNFTAGTKARSSEVNSNFSIYRGNILPVNTDTASSSDLTHNLGSETHRWNDIYGGGINLAGATSTTDFKVIPSTSDTNGSVDFMFCSDTMASLNNDGFSGDNISPRNFTTGSAFVGGVHTHKFSNLTLTNAAYTLTTGRINLKGNGVLMVGFAPSEVASTSYISYQTSVQATGIFSMGFGATTTAISTSTSMRIFLQTGHTNTSMLTSSLRFVLFGLSAGEHVWELYTNGQGSVKMGFNSATVTAYLYEI